MNSINLYVSIGEALDKYSILDIKSTKIEDANKLTEVNKEKNDLYDKLEKFLLNYKYLYNCLTYINLQIWNELEYVKCNINSKEKLTFYESLWLKNEQRYKIKYKKNIISNSEYKEQKGTSQKKVFVYHNFELGDMFQMNGEIRYLTTIYDEVLLVCKIEYKDDIEFMYKDEHNIKLHIVKDSIDIQFNNYKNLLENFYKKKYDIYLAGLHKKILDTTELAQLFSYDIKFYKNFNMHYDVKYNFFYTYRNFEAEERVFRNFKEKLDKKNISKYIFFNGDSNHVNIYMQKNIESDKIYIFNPNINFYPKEHKFYDIWEEQYSKYLIPEYGIFIEKASVICMIYGALFKYAILLNLNHIENKYIYVRNEICYNEICYNEFSKNNDWNIIYSDTINTY